MEVCDLLPEDLRREILPYMTEDVREIRFRALRECVLTGRENVFLPKIRMKAEEMHKLLLHLCDYAVYAHEDQLKDGYLTLRGGHRAGIAGSMVAENDRPIRFSDIQSITLRVARQIPLFDETAYLFFRGKTPLSALVVSPPGLGKTTMLREIARIAGDKGIQTAIADERGEIAACFRGAPQLDVGKCTDVLDGIPKAKAILMLLRACAPQLIVCDEIGSREDRFAIEDAARCGTKVLCSAHGNGIADIMARKNLAGLWEGHMFDRIVVLGEEPGRVCAVYNGEGKPC